MSTIDTAISPSIRGELASAASTIGSVTLLRATLQTAGGGQINVAPTVYREWVSLSRATTATNQNVQEYLGWAIEGFTLPDGAEVVYFERGAIVLRPDGRCFTAYGTMYLHWRDLYDLKTGTGLNIGYPITEEEGVAGGRRLRFDSADMYWNAARNSVFEVHGAIRDRWYALGGYSGFLGFPLSDESSVRRGTSEIGRFGHFEGGTIFWSGATGAFEVHGAIRDAYIDTFSGPVGELGFPVSNETPSPSGMRRYNDFEGGCIVWHADSGAIDVLTNLQVYVANINGSGSHTFWESIGTSSVWLYANCNVTTTTGFNQNFHLPPGGGDYGNPSASPGNVCTVAPVRGDMAVLLTMDGWDHCISTSDQHLGTLRATFTIDNDWGINQPHHIDDGDFHGDIDMRSATVDNPNDSNFRRAEFWGFNNFRTAELSKAQYAETFVDVEAQESSWHWFDTFYYDNFYKGIAKGGNCYGMVLESAYAEHNDSLFSEPIYPVRLDAASYEINVKQGYQLGAAYLDWYVANFLTLQFWDPINVFRAAKDAWDRHDYPLICITNATRSGGHCVRPCPSPSIPYPFVETDSQCIISVANPNAPGTDGTDAASRLVIDKATNTYSIALSNGGTTWTGGHLTGGIMSWVPFSVVCREPRTPFWEALTLALTAFFLFLGDGATTSQITDDSGRVLYKPERVGGNRWDDLAVAPDAIPGLVRVPMFDGFLSHGPLINANLGVFDHVLTDDDSGPELYRLVGLQSPFGKPPLQNEFVPLGNAPANASELLVHSINGSAAVANATNIARAATAANGLRVPGLQRAPGSLTHAVRGRGTYSWGTHTATSSAVITVTSNDSDQLGIERIGAPDQVVSFHAPSGATRTATMVVRSKMPLNRPDTVFTLQNVTVPAGATFKASVLPDGKSLQIQNLGDDCNLQLQVRSGNDATAQKQLQIPGGKTATLTPDDVNALPSTPLRVNIMPSPGGSIEKSITI